MILSGEDIYIYIWSEELRGAKLLRFDDYELFNRAYCLNTRRSFRRTIWTFGQIEYRLYTVDRRE